MALGDKQTKGWYQISLRSSVLAIAGAGILLSWWLDHRALTDRISQLRLTAEPYHERISAVTEMLEAKPDDELIANLIYAIGDPDQLIAIRADKALRRVSGITQGFGTIEGATAKERLVITQAWIDWYVSTSNPF
jgi:hypothetical protein